MERKKGAGMKEVSTQIEKRRLTDLVIDQLVAMITKGGLQAGDKLPPEPELMKRFGVGRGSLREAVGALSLIGLLTVRPGSGTQVSMSASEFLAKPFRLGLFMFWEDKLHELIEARIAFEQITVGMAAERRTEEDLAEIRRHHEALKAAKRSGKKSIQADLQFHIALTKASHNSIMIRFLEELRTPVRKWMEQKASLVGGYESVVEQHEAIVRAIEDGDAERAKTAMKEHLDSVGERLTAILLKRRSQKINGK
jgi:GntR family transcriptional repressor for pyruvate dehydrogenase complex